MEQTRPLFIMLSKTNTGMGKTIRFFTRYDYNHVSLTLDPSFAGWVSFARFVQDVPLAGGFVRETGARFCSMEGPVPVKIYRVELPEGRCRALEALFSQAGSREGQLIYNTFDAMVSPLGIRWPVRGAYTCLEFAGEVLQKRYPSIRALDEALHDWLIFEGDFKQLCSQCAQEGDAYFTKRGFWGGMGDTLVHFGHLISRVIHPKRYKAIEIRENERIQ